MADVTRPDVLGALERAAAWMNNERVEPTREIGRFAADAAALRELADALANQPIVMCSEKSHEYEWIPSWDGLGCGWCAGCRLARLLQSKGKK